MKKMKRFFALFLAMAMVLGMSMTTFAAISGAGITVKGLSTAGDQEVNIYLLYELDENNNLWKRADWATDLPDGDKITDKEKLEELKNPTILENLKKAAANQTAAATDTKDTGSVKFSNLQAGAYLVVARDTTNRVEYGPMVAVTYKWDEKTTENPDGTGLMVANPDTVVVAKASDYKTYKGQKVDADAAETVNDEVVEVGDLIEYTIKATVPYLKEGETDRTFTVTDVLTGGSYYFTGEAVKGVSPKFTLETAAGNEVQLPTLPTLEDNTKFTLDLQNLVTPENTYAGTEVTIVYTVKVNAVDKITNTAETSNGSGITSTPATTTAYTGKITITKKDDTDDSVVLSGARFAVYRMNGTAKEYAYIDASGYVTGEWMTEEEFTTKVEEASKITDATQKETAYNAFTIMTGTEGTAEVKGLDEDTYYFDEVVAPDGYSINTEDVNVKLEAATEMKDSVSKITSVQANTSMTDTRLGSLPSTGGIGTTIFTVGGCAIMILAAGMFFVSRRRTSR